jgi:hypothetical protein
MSEARQSAPSTNFKFLKETKQQQLAEKLQQIQDLRQKLLVQKTQVEPDNDFYERPTKPNNRKSNALKGVVRQSAHNPNENRAS